MDEIKNLKESFERDGVWAEWSAWAIIGGLVLEVCLLLWFSKDRSSFETLSLVAANGIRAAGVFGEIHFGRRVTKASKRLQQISDEKVAMAEARAVEAKLETERLRAQFSWRMLSPKTILKLRSVLMSKGAGSVIICFPTSDPESHSFAMLFQHIFEWSKWTVGTEAAIWSGDIVFELIIQPDLCTSSFVLISAFTESEISFTSDTIPEWESALCSDLTATDALIPARLYVGPKSPVFQPIEPATTESSKIETPPRRHWRLKLTPDGGRPSGESNI